MDTQEMNKLQDVNVGYRVPLAFNSKKNATLVGSLGT